jgi:hypothetical protein
LEKNRDRLSPNLKKLMESSTLEFIKDLFSVQLDPVGRLAKYYISFSLLFFYFSFYIERISFLFLFAVICSIALLTVVVYKPQVNFEVSLFKPI